MTAVIARSEDQFVIFRLEKYQASKVDPDFEKQISDAGIDRGLYERMTEERALQTALSDKITAQLLTGPVEQREVSYVAATVPEKDDAQIQVSHILYSPKDDPNTAGDLEPTDPAWAAAEKEANDLVARLKSGSSFETEAKKSDDKTSGADGGLLAWAPKGTYVPEFDTAIWADGVKRNDILGPIKTQFGYHVIKFDARRPSLKDRLDELATSLAVDGGLQGCRHHRHACDRRALLREPRLCAEVHRQPRARQRGVGPEGWRHERRCGKLQYLSHRAR